MTRRVRRSATVGGALALMAVAALGPRPRADTEVREPELPSDLDAYLAGEEGAVPGLREEARKEIVWADPLARAPTRWSVVYLHGFSADRHEVDPLPTLVAKALGANLYYARLTGHGRDGEAMDEASLHAWARDAAEAVAIGRRIGSGLVLMGTSTGATLALWAAARPEWRDEVAALLLLSPNLGLRDRAARILLWPWGGLLARLLVGSHRSFDPSGPEQAAHWTTRYPTSALVPMMALVDLTVHADLEGLRAPIFVAYSPRDRIVDSEQTERVFRRFGSARKMLVPVLDDEDPEHHVIAGDIMSPTPTRRLAAAMAAFVTLPLEPPGESGSGTPHAGVER